MHCAYNDHRRRAQMDSTFAPIVPVHMPHSGVHSTNCHKFAARAYNAIFATMQWVTHCAQAQWHVTLSARRWLCRARVPAEHRAQ